MATMSPEAQALIDRIHAIDLARPKLDPDAVENAFNRRLAALGLPARPIRQMPDASSGYLYMIDMADAASRPEATRAAEEAARSTRRNRTLAARNAGHGLALDLIRNAAFDSAEEEALQSAYGAVMEAGAVMDAAAVIEAAGGSVEDLNDVRKVAFDAALERTMSVVFLEAKWAARDAILQAAGSRADDPIWSAAYYTVTDDAGVLSAVATACAEINVLSVFNNPIQRPLVDFWLPMVDAFEAGLFFYWVAPREVVWVARPSFSVADGKLHCEDGPAVEWTTGERYWYWRGTKVPQWLIEEPSRITPEAIRTEANKDLRRCMIERLGLPEESDAPESRSIWQALVPRRWRR